MQTTPTESFYSFADDTEVGIAVLAGLFLEINAGVLLMMISAFFAHEATAFWDVVYATDRRDVQPREQHTHSFLEMLPFCAISFVLCMHWKQFAVLFNKGEVKPDFAFRMKKYRCLKLILQQF